MLFARRSPPCPRERLRVALWPRRSWNRSARYAFARLRRGCGSHHQVAVGVAIGVFVATLPVIGVQFVLAAAAALLLRANVPAALAATFWANPLTLPLIWFASYAAGNVLLAQLAITGVDLARVAGTASMMPGADGSLIGAGSTVARAILVGSVPVGIASALVAYGAARLLVSRDRGRPAARARLNRGTSAQRMPGPAPSRPAGTAEAAPAPA